MSKKISNHIYSLSVGSPPDYEEVIVEIWVNIDPAQSEKIEKYGDNGTITYSNDKFISQLQMEDGRDKIKIEFLERTTELGLYLDEFLEAVERGRKLLLNEK